MINTSFFLKYGKSVICVIVFSLHVSACNKRKSSPELSIAFAPDMENCLVPCTINFSNHSNGATNFEWDFGDGHSSTRKEPNHTFNTVGTHTIRLKGMVDNMIKSSTKEIHVIDPEVCKKVKLFYVIPSDQLDNEVAANVLEEAVEQNRQLWSRYGATFVTEELVKIYSDMTTSEFQKRNDGLHDDIKYNWFGNAINEAIANSEMILDDPNFKAVLFVQVPVTKECQCAAVANYNFAAIPTDMIVNIQRGVEADIGVIGHELGHTFGLPHEDCVNMSDPKGIMCNGTDGGQSKGFPHVQLTQWHFDYLFTEEQKGFFVEHACK